MVTVEQDLKQWQRLAFEGKKKALFEEFIVVAFVSISKTAVSVSLSKMFFPERGNKSKERVRFLLDLLASFSSKYFQFFFKSRLFDSKILTLTH